MAGINLIVHFSPLPFSTRGDGYIYQLLIPVMGMKGHSMAPITTILHLKGPQNGASQKNKQKTEGGIDAAQSAI